MAANPAVQRSGRDSRLYTWFAILMPVIVLLGFARTYYLRILFSGTETWIQFATWLVSFAK